MIRFIIATFLVAGLAARGAGAPVSEYEVKAAFLLNFARYVEWAPEVFQSPDEPLTICVLGQDPFGRALDDVVAGKLIGGRAVAVRRIAEMRDAQGCRILFAGAADRKAQSAAQSAVLSATGALAGVLTVGEAGGKSGENAVINFVVEDGKIRFTVNLGRAGLQKLRVSSRLLGLASSVKQ